MRLFRSDLSNADTDIHAVPAPQSGAFPAAGKTPRTALIALTGALVMSFATQGNATEPPRTDISLDGGWDFRFDADDQGLKEKWYLPGTTSTQSLPVPGCWDAQGIGRETDKLRHNAVGVGWYWREIELPESCAGKRLILSFGAHRSASVWIDGNALGSRRGYPRRFTYDVSQYATAGKHRVVIAVDSRPNKKVDTLTGTFDIIDFMDIHWGGIYDHVLLTCTGHSYIDDVFVMPDPVQKRATVQIATRHDGTPHTIQYRVAPADLKDCVIGSDTLHDSRDFTSGSVETSQGTTTLELLLPDAPKWRPDAPALLELHTMLISEGRIVDKLTTRFALRRFEVHGSEFYLNGEKFFLRGYGDDFTFPKELVPTYAPQACDDFWRDYLQLRRQYGFNAVRHHSMMPPEDYLRAADEVGMLVQPELPIAYEPFYKEAGAEALQLYREVWSDYIKQMRNHPSIMAWCMGNELYSGIGIGQELYDTAKTLDPTRPVIDSDGCAADASRSTLDYLSIQFDEHSLPLGNSRGKYEPFTRRSKPVIVHEMGNISVLPDPAQVEAYNGAVKPIRLEKMRRKVAERKLESHLPRMLEASRRLQAELMKLNIEAARISSIVNGYHQWLFRDYWEQSTGIVDQFDIPRNISADDIRHYNADTVLLWNRGRDSWRSGETVRAEIVISDYSSRVNRAQSSELQVALGKETRTLSVPNRTTSQSLTAEFQAPETTAPQKLILTAKAGDISNSWPLWVYPAGELRPPSDNCIVSQYVTSATLNHLAAGKTVLVTDEPLIFPTLIAKYKPAWWQGDENADHCYGNMVLPHPLLDFLMPDGYAGPHFAAVMDQRPVVLLDEFAPGIDPVFWCLDVPWQMRRKAYLFEARVGPGKLVVSTFNLSPEMRSADPVAAYLYARLIEYCGSEQCSPQGQLSAEWLTHRVDECALPDDLSRQPAFGKIVSHTVPPQQVETYGPPAQTYIVRQNDGEQELTWETPPSFGMSLPAGETVTLTWAGTMGWSSEPEAGPFIIEVNGKRAIEFPFSQATSCCRDATSGTKLHFLPRRRIGPDTSGLFLLTIPSAMIRTNEPTHLTVKTAGRNSRRWFGLHDMNPSK